MKRFHKGAGMLSNMQAFIAIIVIFLMGCVISPDNFLTSGNLINIVKQSLTIALLAYGMSFVVICGSIDLSVSIGVVVGAYVCLLICRTSVLLSILAACAACGAIGLMNAFLINVCKFPSMIATYSMSMLVKGILILMIGKASYNVSDMPAALSFLGFGNLFGILPFAIVVLVAMCAVACFLVKKVPCVRNIYAVGGNADAAAMMGVNVVKTRYIAHFICGIYTGLAGVNMASRVNAAVITGGSGLDMMAIASIVIGGVMMNGGRGKLTAGLWGALVMSMLSNVFKLQTSLNYYYEEAVIGLMLMVVLVIQAVSSRKGAQRR